MAEAQMALMELLVADKRLGDAIAYAKSVQARRPDHASGYLLEGAMHHRQRAWDQALAAYRAGMLKDPRNSELAVRTHQALTAAGRSAEADRFAAERTREHPEDAAFVYQLSMAAIGRGDVAQAEKLLRQLVDRFPRHAVALNNLAWSMVVLGKPGAIKVAERAVAEAPDRPNVMDTLAMALAAEDQVPKALELQKKVVAMAPDEPGLRLNLARIAIQAGDKELARTELTALAARGKQFPMQDEVAKLQKRL